MRLPTKMTGKATLLVVAVILLATACSRSNNLLLGRVEATVGGHTIEVTDCYLTSVPPPQQLQDMPGGKHVYRFTPCRDADILIRDEVLVVNGKSYGRLSPNDKITVDHGRVLINEREAPLASEN